MNRFLYIFTGILLIAVAGCVDIHSNNVQVIPPDQTDPFHRNVLDKCPSHINPHRLVMGQIVTGSPIVTNVGAQLVSTQLDFDKWWSQITPQVDPSKVALSSLSQEPVIDWTKEVAYCQVVPVDNSCIKVTPFGDEMISDCYDLSLLLLRTVEGQNCVAPGTYPVFIYIYAQTNLPVSIKWILPTPVPTPPVTPTPAPKP